jgi:uncharacterized protein YbaP (TraB family)
MTRKLCLSAAALTLMFGSPALAAPAMWTIADDNSSLTMFGSIHIMPKNTEWRTELFDQKLDGADYLVFETDLSPRAIAEIGAYALVAGTYTDGTLLTTAMDETLEAQLRETAKSIGLPFGTILAMKPWMAANTISVQTLMSGGFAEKGVEFLVYPEALAGNVRWLESGEQQIDYMAGLSDDAQWELLKSSVEDTDDALKLTSKMVSSWASGETERLGELILEEMAKTPEVADSLLFERNSKWVPQIAEMLAKDENAMLIVGAGHLAGEGNVLELLEAEGYTVTRIQ